MERRPILLSSVMLRQNPHNVHEWHKRVKLFNGQPHKQILTYTEAVTTVDVEMVSVVVFTAVQSGGILEECVSDSTLTSRPALLSKGIGTQGCSLEYF